VKQHWPPFFDFFAPAPVLAIFSTGRSAAPSERENTALFCKNIHRKSDWGTLKKFGKFDLPAVLCFARLLGSDSEATGGSGR